MFFVTYFWTPGGIGKCPLKYGLSILPSFCTSVHSSVCPGVFLELYNYKFWHGARNPYEVMHDSRIFWKKYFLTQKLGKWTKNGPKSGFFKFIEKFGHYVLLNLFYNENLYNLLCSCANRIFGKIFVSEIWAKMFSDNQIARLFNQPYLQNRSMK